SGLGGLAYLPVVVTAPGCNPGDHQDDRRHYIVAIALPQLLELFAADFLIDFGENIGHETSPPFGALPCPGCLSHAEPARFARQIATPAEFTWRHHSLRRTNGQSQNRRSGV